MSALSHDIGILMIGPFPPPYGGQSVLVKNILESNLAKRFRFHLLNVSHSKPHVVGRLLLMTRFTGKLLATFLRVPGIRLVHIHTSAGPAFWEKAFFTMIGKLFGKKVVLHLHGGRLVSFWNGSGYFRKYIIRKILNVCDTVIVLSAGGHVFVTQEICSTVRTAVLPNAVKLITGHTVHQNSSVTFLYVGHLKIEKGLLDLLHAFSACRNLTGRAIKLKIMGGGDTDKNEKIIREAFTTAGLEGISFVGVLTGADKWREFFSSDIFILPSHSEDLPITILEAMACGLPVITTPVGSIPEVIKNGINGYLVAPRSPSNLAEKMVLLAERPDIRKEMALANIKTVQKEYSFERYQNDLEKVYLNALA